LAFSYVKTAIAFQNNFNVMDEIIAVMEQMKINAALSLVKILF
jgi:hypothetical protein